MKLGIRAKMLGSFGLVTVVFILCLMVVSWVVQDLTVTINQMQQIEHKVVLAHRLQLYINKLKEPAESYLITGSIAERDNFDELINKISRIIKELQGYKGDAEWEALVNSMNQDILKLSEMLITVLFIQEMGTKKCIRNGKKWEKWGQTLFIPFLSSAVLSVKLLILGPVSCLTVQ